MRRVFVIALLGFALVAPARAGLVLGTGENLSWDPSTQSSPTFNVSVQNPGGAVTDPVVAWVLGLAIAPEAGAVGTVSIAAFEQPANYLLAGDSSGIIAGTANPPVQLLVNDLAADFVGIVVPSTGANLLAITFSVTSGTSGTFDIVTYGDPFEGSNWISGNDPTFTPVAFDNVPFPPASFPGSPVTLGTLTVTPSSAVVPEPTSAVLLLCGAAGALLYGRSRRRARRLVA